MTRRPIASRPDGLRRSIIGCIALAPMLSACGGNSVLRQAGLEPVSPAGRPAAVPAPDVRVGDEWRYVVRAELTGLQVDGARIRVVGVDPDGFSVVESWQTGGTIDARYDRNLNPLRSGTAVYTPAYPRYAFPLSIGKTWRGTTLARVQSPGGNGSVRQTLSATVAGWERVLVPAGSFTALRIDIGVDWQSPEDAGTWGSSKETFWYAPEVRNAALHHRVDIEIRQVTNDSVTLLEGFTPGS
jgi:hypothetical protein